MESGVFSRQICYLLLLILNPEYANTAKLQSGTKLKNLLFWGVDWTEKQLSGIDWHREVYSSKKWHKVGKKYGIKQLKYSQNKRMNSFILVYTNCSWSDNRQSDNVLCDLQETLSDCLTWLSQCGLSVPGAGYSLPSLRSQLYMFLILIKSNVHMFMV